MFVNSDNADTATLPVVSDDVKGYVAAMSDRFRWVLKNRDLNQSKWSKLAGLSQSVVGQIVRGERKGQVPHSTLDALASAARVNLDWLATGDGSPDGDEFDPYPTRTGVIAMLRAREVSPVVIESIQGMRFKDGDPGIARWVELAEQFIAADQNLAKVLKLGDAEDPRFN